MTYRIEKSGERSGFLIRILNPSNALIVSIHGGRYVIDVVATGNIHFQPGFIHDKYQISRDAGAFYRP